MAGYTINQLPTTTTLSAGDKIPVFVTDEGSAYKASLTTLLAFFSENFANPEFEVQTAAPTSSGFTVTLTSSSSNIWAIVSPTGNFANGTIALPAAADAADGQTVILTIGAQVLALTLTSSGATFGPKPAGVPASGGALVLRYHADSTSWQCVSTSMPGGAIASALLLFSTGALTLTASGSMTQDVTGDLNVATGGTVLDIAETGRTIAVTDGTTLLESRDTANTVALRVGVSTAQFQLFNALLELSVPVKVTPVNVASLPSAATAGNGARHFVSDATVTTFASVVAGGGANRVPVYSDGTNWRIG